MSQKKPIVDKGLILYKDYEFIFNFLSKEEIGEVVLTLLHNMDNLTLNPSDNPNVNNAFNYIANRIIDYKEKRDKAIKNGKKGGNPLLKRDTTLNPTLNGGDKLKENKIKENKIKDNNIIIKEKNIINNIPKENRFIKPTFEEVFNYCKERNNTIDPQRFIDFYTANGWKVGKNSMKDWKACVRTWEKSNFNRPVEKQEKIGGTLGAMLMLKEEHERREREEAQQQAPDDDMVINYIDTDETPF